jgi:hypothetical protein
MYSEQVTMAIEEKMVTGMQEPILHAESHPIYFAEDLIIT